ncbi:MAG: aldehyde dehydrogenase [Clostridia bacterium]|nr:aldehyde dehydrogenase [Clostridia bacterium]
MEESQLKQIVNKQHDFFAEGKTFSVDFRVQMLKKLRYVLQKNEPLIAEALKIDLGKSAFEGYMCEIGMVYSEISYMLKHIKKFAKLKRVKTPIAQFHSKSYKLPTPYGNVLIMSPWNYPLLLTLGPLVDAIAAGNTAVVKPSAYSPATSEILQRMLCEIYPPEYVAVVTGGRAENACLLNQKFDFIFFTGSQSVGKEVLRRAAENLTPVVLELGGKSPCIVEKSADLKLAAKRIVFGKFLNCGQTCVAPDYVLCDKSIKDRLVELIKEQIIEQYGALPFDNCNYGKIINQKHFLRLCSLIDESKIVHGGKTKAESLQIEPTLLDNVTFEDPVMQEEIFGPILPVITYDNFEEVFTILQDKQKPLALYAFSRDNQLIDRLMQFVRFGGGCVNDTIIHLATSEMGFGGVGESGMGSYHGKTGFDTFTHYKSIVNKSLWLDLPMRYRPYSKSKEKIIKKFLK